MTVLLCAIGDVLASVETVAIGGFGTFPAGERPAHRGRNPHTGENIAIAAIRTPAFKVGKTSRHGRNRVTA